MLQIVYALSWAVSCYIGTVNCWNVCHSLKSQKKLLKPLIVGWFKVVQGRRCRYAGKARQQCLLW